VHTLSGDGRWEVAVPEPSFELRVLGSGGPHSHPTRASAGYLLSFDGVPRILVDVGGGVFTRVGQLKSELDSLELVVLTHLHVDHTGDLAPVLFDLYLRERKRRLAVIGPAPRGDQPGTQTFVDLLFGARGAWRHLNAFDGFRLDVDEASSDYDRARIEQMELPRALVDLNVELQAVAVPHGPMPAISVRISRGEASVVLTGDVSASTPALVSLARECSVLVHDMALPEGDLPHGHLHAKPSHVARTAVGARPKHLVLSHFLPPILAELEETVSQIKQDFRGEISIAHDLATYPVE
jgi:ribonuclease BN (tRNA processing enzyme)